MILSRKGIIQQPIIDFVMCVDTLINWGLDKVLGNSSQMFRASLKVWFICHLYLNLLGSIGNKIWIPRLPTQRFGLSRVENESRIMTLNKHYQFHWYILRLDRHFVLSSQQTILCSTNTVNWVRLVLFQYIAEEIEIQKWIMACQVAELMLHSMLVNIDLSYNYATNHNFAHSRNITWFIYLCFRLPK